MENVKKTKAMSISIYIILIAVIIILSAFLIWSIYIKDMYKEYISPYNENCYTVEHDGNSITITKYNKDTSTIYSVCKTNFENGKAVSEENKEYYKNKSIAKNTYEDMIKPQGNSITHAKNIKLNKNCVEFMYDLNDNISYDSEEIKQKVESFTTNQETIKYLLQESEQNNFGLPKEFKRID